MNTRLFSHPVVEQFLPEVVGDKHRDLRFKIAQTQKHRCAISGYPYPPLKPAVGQKAPSTHLVLDLPSRDAEGKPLSASQAVAALKRNGPSDKTLIAVCPLAFWSTHVDLALRYGRGDVVLSPGLSQSEINSVFRTLLIAIRKGDQNQTSAALSGDADEVLRAFDMTFGRHEVLREAMCLPETVEWDTQLFLSTIQAMPERERTIYMRQFAKHLRFWPSKDAFYQLGGYWGAISHSNAKTAEETSTPWPEQYADLLKRVSESQQTNIKH